MKRLPPFLSVVIGLSLLFGGLIYFVMMTGFTDSGSGGTFSVWLQRTYTLTYPYPDPTEEAFDRYSHFAFMTCLLGFGFAFWGLLADGCILKQPRSRQIVANLFGVITFLCAILELLVCAHWYWICRYTLWGGYPFDPASMFFLFPAAVVCTVLSVILVGMRRCKLSWISLCLFALPLWDTYLMIPRWDDYISTKYVS